MDNATKLRNETPVEEKERWQRGASEISRRKLQIDSAPPSFFFRGPAKERERERAPSKSPSSVPAGCSRVDSFFPSLGKREEAEQSLVGIAIQLSRKRAAFFREKNAELRERNNRFESDATTR